jgi:UPF0271 protein
MKIDFNCDLGEGEPMTRTRALMRWISSANVACGGHAGDLKTMQTCVRLAGEFRVRLGAHPGPWSRSDLGRGALRVTPEELELLLIHQISALDTVARRAGMALHHIKLHGALYHATESNETLASRYVATVKRWWPRAKIYALAGGSVVRVARNNNIVVWEEAFADRGYRDDGSLMPRNEPGALLTDPKAVRQRVSDLVAHQQVTTVTGQALQLRPQTICLHSDSPKALELARTIGRLMQNEHFLKSA